MLPDEKSSVVNAVSHVVGDVFNQEESEARITPVPGGVGLLTRCALLENVMKAKELKDENL